MASLGVRILGGCCGTTPLHIRRIAERLSAGMPIIKATGPTARTVRRPRLARVNDFYDKLTSHQPVAAVELDPPASADPSKLEEALRQLRSLPVDMVTVADSPSGKVRMNALVTALRIHRRSGLSVMPHFCCRDRNLIGLKSDLLAAHAEGIRNVLLVTGDPIPQGERNEIKSVFNCHSISLLELLKGLNESEFSGDPIRAGAALNLMASHPDALLARVEKKVKAGASFFLTQPVFDTQALATLRFLKSRLDIKVLVGLLPIVSLKNGLFLNNEFPGIRIPDASLARFTENMDREKAEATGIALAAEMGEAAASVGDGFYFITPFFRVNMVSALLKRFYPTMPD